MACIAQDKIVLLRIWTNCDILTYFSWKAQVLIVNEQYNRTARLIMLFQKSCTTLNASVNSFFRNRLRVNEITLIATREDHREMIRQLFCQAVSSMIIFFQVENIYLEPFLLTLILES